jgi:hypothetical protein
MCEEVDRDGEDGTTGHHCSHEQARLNYGVINYGDGVMSNDYLHVSTFINGTWNLDASVKRVPNMTQTRTRMNTQIHTNKH